MENGQLKIRENDISWRRIGDEVIVLDLRSNSYLSVNQSGTALWDMLVDGTTSETLAARLASEFALDEERARADADAFVAILSDRGLLG